MSRFLADRLLVGIEANRLTLVRLGGILRHAIIDAESIPLPNGEAEASALAFLERELQTPRWRCRRVSLTLADSLVRYFISPLPEGGRNRRELHEAAKLRCEAIFGEDARAWTTVVDFSPFASNHLGVAIRTEWLEGLRTCCQISGRHLTRIVPFGVSEFNRNERRIGRRSGWFAVHGTDSLLLAYKDGNGWGAVQVHRRLPGALNELPQWLAQDRLRNGIEDQSGLALWLAGDLAAPTFLSQGADNTVHYCSSPIWPARDEFWSRTFRQALSPVWPCA